MSKAHRHTSIKVFGDSNRGHRTRVNEVPKTLGRSECSNRSVCSPLIQQTAARVLDPVTQGIDAGSVATEGLPVVDYHEPRFMVAVRLPLQQLRQRRALEQACHGSQMRKVFECDVHAHRDRTRLCFFRLHSCVVWSFNLCLFAR